VFDLPVLRTQTGGVTPTSAPAKTSFWNFRDKKIYTSSGQKLADFLFGVLAPTTIWVVLGIVLFASAVVFDPPMTIITMLWIAAMAYLFNRRRFMSYGMVVSLAIFMNAMN
jgi:hypothetical protein